MVRNTPPATDIIADSIRLVFDSLTRAERQLANTIVKNYPVSGLGSITQVAEKSGLPSAWDSSVELLLLVKTFIAAVQELTWPETRVRMEDLEDMFDRTRFFRKFT